ncbi:MAG: ATP synthase F1 subunit gamma [Bryobacterales bacterium]|nr:ATP synthase F1 subunit gamma [Bryobacteraceae bacterium]MDW8130245.1 ATP synthase F1 subunit gamma [Bryobacterales bacterium]
MPSLIDLRRRIRSVRNTQQVTKAMKMVSAAKLRRAQDRVLAARPYAAMYRELRARVAAAVATDERLATHPLLAQRPEERIVLVFFTADRGLAGAFNTNLIRAAQAFIAEQAGKQVQLVTIGRKGRDFFRKRHFPIAAEYTGFSQKFDYADAASVARFLIERYARAETDAVYLLYNEFKSLISARLTTVRVLPVQPAAAVRPVDYIFEQPPRELLEGLLPRYVEVAVYQALLESVAAEHAARMTAMDQATNNAAEMIARLTLYMNRVRQASITKEIIEVVSGAEALE